jgi:protein SCO1
MIRTPQALIPYILLCACVLAGALWSLSESLSPVGTLTLSQLGGPFTLTDQAGKPRSDADFRGQYLLVYFGYTFCPDICPTTLASEADALDRLGQKSARITPIFITIDPARDTPQILASYMHAFGPRFIGLTGSDKQIAAVAHEYRVYYAKRALPGGYAMDHSGQVYLMGPDGKLIAFYDPPIDGKKLAADLNTKLPPP